MAATRVLSQEEREEILAHIKPTGAFKPPKERRPFGSQPVMWEEQLGDLNEWRKHPGMGRAIVEKLTDPVKTQSVQNSILNRLRKLYPEESWSTFVDGKYVYLKFGGAKRSYAERIRRESGEGSGHGLFAETG